MKQDIIHRLSVVANALNSVSVCGKNNLANLSGSIAMVEEIMAVLSKCDVITQKGHEAK